MNVFIVSLFIILLVCLFIQFKNSYRKDYIEQFKITNSESISSLPSQLPTSPPPTPSNTTKHLIKDMSQYSKSIVKITVQNIEFDWIKPFSSKSNETIGTGFLINDEGIIVTCSHVVDNAIKIYVSIPMQGQEKYDANVIGICPDLDVAILQCSQLKNHKYLELGDSDTIKPNDKAIALGYPLGQDKLKFTSGIISGRQDGKLQIDTPINGGNSGGPLLNEYGQVIGINFLKVRTEEAENVGYAIPIKQFINIMEEMKTNKLVHSPKLGAMFQNMNSDMRKFIKNNKSECKSGFYVRNVVKDGPLYNAGLKTGDVLCSFDGIKLDNYGEMNVPWNIEKVHIFDYMKRLKNTQQLNITIWKSDNTIQKKQITLNNPYINGVRNYYPTFEKVDFEVFGGLVVMKLANNHTPLIKHNNMNRYKDIKYKQDEVLVITHVFPGSYINKLNVLSKGDIIEKVNDLPVSNIMEYRNAIHSMKNVNNEDFITIQALDKYYCVLPISLILEDEPFLADKHKYKLGEVYNKFIKKI